MSTEPEKQAQAPIAAPVEAAPAAPSETTAATEPASQPQPDAPKDPKPAEVEEEYPDPDEDDLDDLDDMLDEFSAVKLTQKNEDKPSSSAPTAPASENTTKPSTGSTQPNIEDAFMEDDFAKQLQAGMADLLGELDKSPEMQQQFEDIFKQINAAAAAADLGTDSPAPADKGASPPGPSAPGEASFQDTIRATMERMQNSGDQATAAAASGGGADDFMAEMLKALGSGDFGAGGGEDSEDFSKMLMGMMEQLTNKEILYEPMKELHDKFPEWMEKNKDKTPEVDMARYEAQKVLVAEIVGKFEERTYKDSNPADREYIVDRMQKMQAQGSPPSDLVGDMSSAQDAFAGADDQCNPQ